MQETLKKKLDVEFPYVILAFNPPLAKRAIEAEPAVGEEAEERLLRVVAALAQKESV